MCLVILFCPIVMLSLASDHHRLSPYHIVLSCSRKLLAWFVSYITHISYHISHDITIECFFFRRFNNEKMKLKNIPNWSVATLPRHVIGSALAINFMSTKCFYSGSTNIVTAIEKTFSCVGSLQWTNMAIEKQKREKRRSGGDDDGKRRKKIEKSLKNEMNICVVCIISDVEVGTVNGGKINIFTLYWS